MLQPWGTGAEWCSRGADFPQFWPRATSALRSSSREGIGASIAIEVVARLFAW